MTRSPRITHVVLALTLSFTAGAASAEMITVTPKFTDDPTATQKALVADAIMEWTSCLFSPQAVNLTLNFTFTDLGKNSGGQTTNLMADGNGNPMSADIKINTNAVMYYGFDLPVPADQYDALTAIKHEIGHALGFAGGTVASGLGYKKWNDQLTTDGFNVIFDKNGLNIMMAGPDNAGGRSHLDPLGSLGDLMIPAARMGMRTAPSARDFMMLNKAFGFYQLCPEPSTLALASIGSLGLVVMLRSRRAVAVQSRDRPILR
jgi:hypothetical protein